MRRNSVIALAALIASALSLSTATVMPASATEETACTTAAIMAFRGSGETAPLTKDFIKSNSKKKDYDSTKVDMERGSGISTDLWEGPILYRALNGYERQVRAMDITQTGIQIYDIGEEYEAVSIEGSIANGARKAAPILAPILATIVDPVTAPLGIIAGIKVSYAFALADILRSSRTGVSAGLGKIGLVIAEAPKNCGVPRYVLMGYSQGAMAARQLYSLFGDGSVISGVMGFGDPFQSGLSKVEFQEKAGLHGDGAEGSGVFMKESLYITGDGIDKKLLDSLYLSDTPRYSYCHKGDPMCDYKGLLSMANLAPHLSYATDRDEADEGGKWLAETVLSIKKEHRFPRPPTPDLESAYPWGEWTLNSDSVDMTAGHNYNISIAGLLRGQRANIANPGSCWSFTLGPNNGKGPWDYSNSEWSKINVQCIKWNGGDDRSDEWEVTIPNYTPAGKYYIYSYSAHDGAGAIAVNIAETDVPLYGMDGE